MRRILLLIPSLADAGGTERVVHSLSALLADMDHKVFQATFDSPEVQRNFKSIVPLYQLGPFPRLPISLRPFTYMIAARRLFLLKKKLDIDVTISNLWGADLISILSGGSDRKIALCHTNVVGNPANRMMLRFRPLVAAIYRRFDRVVAVSETLASELKILYRLPPVRIEYINNFVDRPEAISTLPDDDVQRFVWCGRLSPEKNVDGLLLAWKSFAEGLTGVQLILVGDGPLRHDLFQLAASLGLRIGTAVNDSCAQVIFTGKVKEPATYMLGACALLLSSYSEGLPMVVLEALSLGLPVLSSDCNAGGVRTVLLGYGSCNPDRKSAEITPAGMLLPVPRSDVPETLLLWQHALVQVLTDRVQREEWQRGALERSQHFSSQGVRSRWLQVLDF